MMIVQLPLSLRIAVFALASALTWSYFAGARSSRAQNIRGGASGLLEQDIIGGASIAFKRPPRERDIIGGLSPLPPHPRLPRQPPPPPHITPTNPTTPPPPPPTPQ